MKSKYQERLIAQLADQITEAQEAWARSEVDANPASDFVILSQKLSRIDLTPDQFESVAEKVNEYQIRYSPFSDDLADRIITVLWQALDHRAQLRAQFEQFSVEAASVADFMARYYKTDRYTGRNKATGWHDEYAAELLADREADFAKNGYTFIGEHEFRHRAHRVPDASHTCARCVISV